MLCRDFFALSLSPTKLSINQLGLGNLSKYQFAGVIYVIYNVIYLG